MKIVADGRCSLGVGNTVESYASTFSGLDIRDQPYNNPAGQFKYSQLLAQAKMQTHVLTELFDNTCVPKSVFSAFIPNTKLPTTDYLSAQPPTDPNPTS